MPAISQNAPRQPTNNRDYLTYDDTSDELGLNSRLWWSPQPGNQLFHVEGFGNVIICAGIKARHLVAPPVAGGEDEHRHLVAFPAPGFQNADPIHNRQAQIQDHTIIRFRIAQEVTLFAVGGIVDHIAGIGQGVDQLPVDIGIIFNDEYAHKRFLFARQPNTELAAHHGSCLSINHDNVQLALVARFDNISWGSATGKSYVEKLACGRHPLRDAGGGRGRNELVPIGLGQLEIGSNAGA